jgi:hypothetical protein
MNVTTHVRPAFHQAVAIMKDSPLLLTPGTVSSSQSRSFNNVASMPVATFVGYFDSADCNTIYGWAWDSTQPDTSINVDIYDGSNYLTTIQANQFRSDLPGNKYHAFNYVTPGSLKDGFNHSIRIKFSGTNTELTNSPKSLTCAGAPPTFVSNPTSGQAGTTFTYTGSGLTPNGRVQRFGKRPVSGIIDNYGDMFADGNGNLSWSYTYKCSDELGDTTAWIIDVSKNYTTPLVHNYISQASACVTPTFTSNPTSGQAGTTFTYNGSGLTPNGRIQRFGKRPVSGIIDNYGDMFADSIGNLSWQYTYRCSDELGDTTAWIIDVSKNYTTPLVHNNISQSNTCITPTFASNPTSGQAGTTFTYNGSGLTPNGRIQRFGKRPVSGIIDNYGDMFADGNGNLSWSYTYKCSDELGDTTAWIIDVAKNYTTPIVHNVISQSNTCLTPTFTSNPTSGQAGTIFTYTGSGLTPNGRVQRFGKRPVSGIIDNYGDMFADGNGNLSWQYTYKCSDELGDNTAWIIDAAKNYTTTIVHNVIASSSSCAATGDRATFVSETILDGTPLNAGQLFTKTWTIHNNGTTTWNSNYRLRWVSGASLSDHADVIVAGTVAPGADYTFSVPMTAPTNSGSYREDWKFINGSGPTIQVGNSSAIWVSINVGAGLPSSPNITRATPGAVQQSDFTLTIEGTGFDGGASDQIYLGSRLIGSGAIQSLNGNRIIVLEHMSTATPGTYTIKVRNSDGRISNGAPLTITEPPSGSLSINPSQTYNRDTSVLTLAAVVQDTSYGTVNAASSFTWSLRDSNGVENASGTLKFDGASGTWRGQQTLIRCCGGGFFTVRYDITTDRGRTASAVGPMSLGGLPITVTGTIKDAATSQGIPGANVALFDADAFWQVVLQRFNGTIPTLVEIQPYVVPRRVTTTANDGTYAWTDAPTGKAIVVAGKSAYLSNSTQPFNISANSTQFVKNLSLSSIPTLLTLGGEVDGLGSTSNELMNANAENMAEIAQRVNSDALFAVCADPASSECRAELIDLLIDIYNTLGGAYASAVVEQPAQKVTQKVLQDAINKAIAKQVKEFVRLEAAQGVASLIGQAKTIHMSPVTTPDGFKNTAMATGAKLQLDNAVRDFSADANSRTISSSANREVMRHTLSNLIEQLRMARSNELSLIAPPNPNKGVYVLGLNSQKLAYLKASENKARLGFTKNVLTGVEFLGTTAQLLSIGTGVSAGVVVPLAEGVKTAAGIGKAVIMAADLANDAYLTNTFAVSLGTYASDNTSTAEIVQDTLDFLRAEASAPNYFRTDHKYLGTSSVNLNLPGVFGNSVMYVPVWRPLEYAKASVQVSNTGNVNSIFRVIGYGTWTSKSLFDFSNTGPLTQPVSVDFKLVALNPGETKQVDLVYSGYRPGVLNLFDTQYLYVNVFSGPFLVATNARPFNVIPTLNLFSPTGAGKGFDTSTSAGKGFDKTDYAIAAATEHGQVRGSELALLTNASTSLIDSSLSSATPTQQATFTADANLYAADLRLFAPPESQVSILVEDGQGRKLGYAVADGVSYHELLGSVSETGEQPVKLRLLNPPAGTNYTVKVTLLSSGLLDVPVTLFYEPIKRSGAVMTTYPASVVIDGDSGSTQNLLVRLGETSIQQSLTGVRGTLGDLTRQGAASIKIGDNATQILGDVPASSQRTVSWNIAYPVAQEHGKYTGSATFSSNETTPLTVPVVALVRNTTETVNVFEGPASGPDTTLQKSLTFGPDGTARTWVFVPRGFRVMHASMTITGISANLLNPSLDIGADGLKEWVFSGKFDLGVSIDGVEGAFNKYLDATSPGADGWSVPIEIRGPVGETAMLNGIQLYLDTKNTVQLSASSYTVAENAGSIQIAVTRSGDNSAGATIDYSTSDGTAHQRTDYTTASGTLSFGPGEASKSFEILITDNAFVDGNRTINVSLNNPTGSGFLGAPVSATVTINDNDTVSPVINPIDEAQAFVRQQYSDFLNRAPDTDGLGYWSYQITQCGANAQCIHDRRVGVADAFFFEPEFQQTGAYIYRVYKSALGARPTYDQFISDRGRVVVGPGLDSSKTAFALTFEQRADFLQLYPRTLTASQFVDALLNRIKTNSGADLSTQRGVLISMYDGTDAGRAAILRQAADSQTFTDAEYNSSFVLMEYFGYLRRDPDQQGFDFWLSQVNKFPLRNVGIQHAMACSFITSAEYQTRFSSIISHTNRECPQ